jgi:hypothetical protein
MNPLSTRPIRWRPITVFNLLVGLFFSLSALAQPAFVTNGLVAYLPFDGTAVDKSVNGLTVNQFSVQGDTNRFNEPLGALRFSEGDASGVVIRQSSVLPSGNTSRTISLWYKMDPNLPNDPFRSIRLFFSGEFDYQNDVGGKIFSFGFTSDRGVDVDFRSAITGKGGMYRLFDGSYFSSKWIHLTVVVENNRAKTYKDGNLISWLTSVSPDLIVNTVQSDIWIGGVNGYKSFQGLIDDVRIYDRAMSAQEVVNLHKYESSKPLPMITRQPSNLTVVEGGGAQFEVIATGVSPLRYQWQFNGLDMSGENQSVLQLSPARPTKSGSYTVLITDLNGTTTSSSATLTVVVTDTDSDGLSDYEELLLGTNANKADSDGDGLSDFAEVRTHKSNPLTTDTDGDGYSDGIEVARDGNPNNRSVTPTGALAVFPAVDVEFYTLNGVKYQLEVSTDMVNWTAQGGVVVGTGGSQNHLVRASKATQFWRLKVVQ